MSRRLLVSISLLALVLAPIAVRGATPSEGTINQPPNDSFGERAKLTYQGAAVGGALVVAELEQACVVTTLPVQCDEFLLHINLPTDYYVKRLGKVTARLEATIDWSEAPQATSQDIDLLVVNSDGEVVGSSTDPSGNTSETAVIPEIPGGDYRVVTAASLGSIPGYTGTIRLILSAADAINTVSTKAIKFGAGTVVNPTYFGAEPMVASDRSLKGGWWIDWPIGTRSATGQLYRSLDGGDTFRQIYNARCPERRQPGCFTHGGGDTMTVVSKGGVVYWANQEALFNEAVNASTDHGMTWPSDRENAITSLQVTADRQWLATHGDNTAYIVASAGMGTGLARTDDGGKTWQSLPPLQSALDGASAPIAVDESGGPRDGTFYALTRNNGITIAVSRDKGETFTKFPNDDLPNSGPAGGTNPQPDLLFPWMTIDRAGNLYVAWSDTADGAVHMTTMKADDPRNAGDKLGSTWSKPVTVSIPPATTTVFSQVAAGDPGRVAITYQSADVRMEDGKPMPTDQVPLDTPWYVYAAFSTNALCQWDGSCPTIPSFRQTKVTERVNHIGQICTSGIGCTADPNANRNLLDFFDLDTDSDGRVGVTWTDDNHGYPNTPTSDRNGYIMFAKVTDGPSLLKGRPDFGSTDFATASVAPGTIVERAGDALWPLTEPDGKNFSTLDLTGTSVTLGLNSLNFKVKLGSTANFADGLEAGLNTQHIKYLTRWSHKNDVYFVAADTSGDDPQFYGGKIDDGDELLRSGVSSVYGTTYVPDFDVTGSVADGVLNISVPLAQIGNPRVGERLYSLQSFTLAGPVDELQSVYTAAETIDATPAIDYVVGAKVLRAAQRRPAPKPKTEAGHLAATGVADARVLGAFLMAAAAFGWRRLRRETI